MADTKTEDLISRSALKEEIRREVGKNRVGVFVAKRIFKLIDNAPTVKVSLLPADESKDEAYMRGYEKGLAVGLLKTRPQGEWIEGENGCIRCNKCGCEIIYSYIIGNKPELPKFCCDCGAKMFKNEGADNG